MQRRVAVRIRAGRPRQALAPAASDLVPTIAAGLAAGSTGLGGRPAPLRRRRPRRPGDDDRGRGGFDLATLPTIAAPTLIVAGADDRFYGPGLLAETAALIAGSRLEVIPGRGHVTVAGDPASRPPSSPSSPRLRREISPPGGDF